MTPVPEGFVDYHYNCAVSALYVAKGLRRVTAQLPIPRQLGSNARPGKTGRVW